MHSERSSARVDYVVAIGVGAMFILSAFGGFGTGTGLSNWWGLLLVPYAAGWVAGLAGSLLALVESFKRPT